MEKRKDVHYEIQRENSHGEWAEFLHERPNTEEAIPELCSRTHARYPHEKIRAVKVTTLVMVEEVFEQPDAGIPAHEVEREPSRHEPVHELLQDCD